MTSTRLLAFMLAMFSTAAFAQSSKPAPAPAAKAEKQATLQRVVLTGARTKILTYYAVDPNCSPTGTVTVHVLKQPSNGKLETDTGPDFTHYPNENVRSKCNDKEVQMARVWYQSKPDYKGNDEAEFEVIYPDGKYGKGKLMIVVK